MQSLSLFPKLNVSLVPGTLLYDQENSNAQSKAKQTIIFDANMLVKGVWQLEMVKSKLMC